MPQNLTLHSAFQAPLQYGQFAKNGIWEEAWKFNGANLPEHDSVIKYLNGVQEVAFEAFFGEAFFGLRFRGTADAIQTGALACVKAYQSHSVEISFFSTLSKLLRVPSWGQDISFAEVGAVNFWKSVGPYRLPDMKKAQSDPQSILQDLLSTPVGRNTQHPKALELGCDGQFPHWFGLPISNQIPPYDLSDQLLTDALACL